MKNLNDKSIKIAMLALLTVVVAVSCSKIYDNIEKYASSETVYVDKLDGIERVQIGYERVEIDLLKAGRIPASRIIMHKAKKTVIECPDFTEPGNRRVIDSICSWVNVTGLTDLKDYRLTIYTEDEYGNRSLPLTVDVRPYTAENRDALILVVPSIIESTSAVMVEWKDRISAQTHTVFGYSWSYTDRSGAPQTGGDKGDMPSFFVENIERGRDVPVELNFRIVPIITNAENSSTPILDTIDWKPNFFVHISEDARPAIFLKEPVHLYSFNLADAATIFPFTFLWVKVPEVSQYRLKLSPDASFPAAQTVEKNLGDVSELTLSYDEWLALVYPFPFEFSLTLYWTVVPVVASEPIRTQSRSLTAIDWEDITSRKLKNTEIPFAKGAGITVPPAYPGNAGRIFLAADWITNDAAARNGTLDSHTLFSGGALGFFVATNFGPDFPALPVVNGKLYQTVELEPGSYKFHAFLLASNNGTNPQAYVVADLGDDLPDTNDVEQTAMTFLKIPNGIANPANHKLAVEFVLSEKTVVSLGFVGSYSPQTQIYFRKIELLWKKLPD